MNIYEKLLTVQSQLKVPKAQVNNFGNYKYRNCEDILENVKPHLLDVKATLLLFDDIVFVDGRFYIKATATLVDAEKPTETIVVCAYAREEESKKGMDGSQVTGASSSYARKYALNGLFNIDDTRDSDTTNTGETEKKTQKNPDKTLQAQKKQEEVKKAQTTAPSNGSFTLTQAYARTTQKGKTYGELPDDNLQYIIDSDKSHPDSKTCAQMILDARADVFVETTPDGDLPF
ncbi:MAG: ERF family protein [Clostridia bacterium]